MLSKNNFKKLISLIFFIFFIFSFKAISNGATYTVSNNADSGAGSLRQAITDANASAGADTINFSISAQTITPLTQLPTLSDTTGGTTIDGTGQNITIDGNGVNISGFQIESSSNTIKGLTIIRFSAAGKSAIVIQDTGSGAASNTIAGNYLGTDSASTVGLGNYAGVIIQAGAQNNTVGGNTAATRNIISANSQYGILLSGANTKYNIIKNNYIGTNVGGTVALANGVGIQIDTQAKYNIIGGTYTSIKNLISGNTGVGIVFDGANTSFNQIEYNYIGLDISKNALANGVNYITQQNGAANNIFCKNDYWNGVLSADGQCTFLVSTNSASGAGSLVQAMTDANATDGADTINFTINNQSIQPTSIPVFSDTTGGTTLDGTGQNITIDGGSVTGTGLKITTSNNAIKGFTIVNCSSIPAIYITGSSANNNTISGNTISANPLAPNNYGIVIESGAKNNTIGGTIVADRNIIAANNFEGIIITGSGTTDNVVIGNYIGVDATGNVGLANAVLGGSGGISITSSAANNIIGGSALGERNIISGNNGSQIYISSSSGNIIKGNYIGLNAAGNTAIGDNNGIVLSAASTNTIGGANAGEGNVISGNAIYGIRIIVGSANIVKGNLVGTNAGGTIAIGNGYGIQLDSTSSNSIGGALAGEGNVVSANNFDGIIVNATGSISNQIIKNFVGTDSSATLNLGNGGSGIVLYQTGQNTVQTNTVKFNDHAGIYSYATDVIYTSLVSDNTITGNTISDNGQNPAPRGEGIYNEGSSPTISSNSITNNAKDGILNTVFFNADTYSDTDSNAGSNKDIFSNPTITGNTINNNGTAISIHSIDNKPSLDYTTLNTNNTLSDTVKVQQDYLGFVKVLDSSNNPVNGAVVSLYDKNSVLLSTGATDIYGYYPNQGQATKVDALAAVTIVSKKDGVTQEPTKVNATFTTNNITQSFTFDGSSTDLDSNDSASSDSRFEIAVLGKDRVDLQIKNSPDVSYTGNGIYNEDATAQTLANGVGIYHLKIENDDSTIKSYTVTGTASDANWEIKYYDAVTAGNDITANVTGAGYAVSNLAAASNKVIRAEVKQIAGGAGSKVLIVTATSQSDNLKKDVVKATTYTVDNFVVSASPTNPSLCNAATITVTAKDQFANTLMTYQNIANINLTQNGIGNAVQITWAGTGITDTGTNATLSANNFSNGVATVTLADSLAEGPVTATVTEADYGGKTGNTNGSGTNMTWSDTTPPTNPTTTNGWKTAAKVVGEEVYHNTWEAITANPYFEWTGQDDGACGTGIQGFSVYFGASASGEPGIVLEQAATNYDAGADPGVAGTYYFRVRTFDNNNNFSSAATIFTVKYDDTTPANIATINDSTSTDIDWTNSLDTLSANWSTSSDAQSGIAKYWYCIGTTSGGCETVVFTNNSTTANVTKGSLTLANGQIYYITVKAENGAGLQSNTITTDGITTDNVIPAITTLTSTTHSNQVNWYTNHLPDYSWTSSDAGSAVKGYYYVLDATNTQTANYVKVSGTWTTLNTFTSTYKADGTWYYHLVAEDNAGNLSSVSDYATNIDSTSPSISTLSSSTHTNQTKYYNINLPAYSWTSDDSTGSGVKGYYYLLDNTSTHTTTEVKTTGTYTTSTGYTTAPAKADGVWYFHLIAEDYAGNLSSVSAYTTNIDTTQPNISSVASSSVTSSNATISWTTNELANSTIEYGLDTNYGTVSSNGSLLTSHSITLSSLTASTTYHYRVKSKDDAGNETISIDYTFTTTTPDTTPPIISAVTSSSITNSSAVISWTTNENSDSLVNYGTTASYGSSKSDATSTTAHSISLTSLSANTTYHYKVTSKDAANNSASSTDYTFTTSATPDTTPPVISAVTSANVTGSSATISWTTNEASDSLVDYGLTNAYGSSKSDVTSTTTHSITLTSLSSSTTYHYKVTSKDAANNSASSIDYTFTTTTPDTTPPIISAVTSSSITYNSATISWTTDESADSLIDYGTTNLYGSTKSDTNYLTSHSLSLTSLSSSTTYHYKVTSKDASTNSSSSIDYTFTTTAPPDTTAPSAPAVLTGVLQSGNPSLTWSANTELDLSGYNVYRSITSGSGYTKINSSSVTLPQYTDSNITIGTTYYYVVTALDTSNNESTYSNEVNATPFAIPSAPANVSVTARDTQDSLSWTTATQGTFSIQGYNVYRSTSSGSGYAKINSTTVTAVSYTDTNLTNGTKYYYVIKTVDTQSNESNSSSEVNATPYAKPNAPSSLSAKTGDKQLTLSWSAPTTTTYNISGYNIYRGTTSGGTYSKVNQSVTTNTQYTDTGLTNHTTYYYVITAVDSAGNESSYSSESSATPRDLTSKLLPVGISMIAIPISAVDKNPASILEITSGFNLAKWVKDDSSYHLYSQNPADTLFQLKPGEGYFIKLDYQKQVNAYGTLTSQNIDYTIPLKIGWNQIGNPFNFNVKWENVKVKYQGQTKTLLEAVSAGWIGGYAFAYPDSTTGYQIISPVTLSGTKQILEPWLGYWVLSAYDVDLIIPPTVATKNKSENETDFNLKVIASNDNLSSSIVIGKNKTNEFIPLPPAPLKGSLEIYLQKSDSKYLAEFNNLINQVTTFEFVVKSTEGKQLNLKFEISNLPDGYYVYLTDLQTNKETDITDLNQPITVTVDNEKKFKLQISKFSKELLSQNMSLENITIFPNPIIKNTNINIEAKFLQGMPSNADIEIYNKIGKLISKDSVLAEYKGKDKIKLSSPNLNNVITQLPNGIYFGRITFYNTQNEKISKVVKIAVMK